MYTNSYDIVCTYNGLHRLVNNLNIPVSNSKREIHSFRYLGVVIVIPMHPN